MTETLLLSVCGDTLGLALSMWAIRAIGATAPAFMGLDSALRIDHTVLAFTLCVSLLAGVVFGLVPAIQGSNTDLASVLRGATGGGESRRGSRLLSTLVRCCCWWAARS